MTTDSPDGGWLDETVFGSSPHAELPHEHPHLTTQALMTGPPQKDAETPHEHPHYHPGGWAVSVTHSHPHRHLDRG
jgi:hypothetical protein